MKRNSCGYLYKNGARTEDDKRSEIMYLYSKGKRFREISEIVGLTKGGCHKVVKKCTASGTVKKLPVVGKSTKVSDDVMHFIEYEKFKMPSVYSREIKSRLLKENVCTNSTVPCTRQITRTLKTLGMTRKVLQIVPTETQTPGHEQRVDAFIAKAMQFRPQQLHFFDEASVVRTSGNRRYGHSPCGARAVEVQRYASNATFTVNLACGYFGIDYHDVIEGPSNAMEMLQFFDQCMQQTNDIGNPVLAKGDCVILDNCGFHHHRQAEQLLRNMLNRRDITLLFQPPYSPEYNVAEYVFHLMRNGLRENPDFTYSFTELATVNVLNSIPSHYLSKLFTQCGYV